MRYSIRLKIFFALVFLVIALIASSWLLNANFLEEYYIGQKTKTLNKRADLINNLYTENIGDLELQLEIYERNSAISAIILDQSLEMERPSFFRRPHTDPRAMLVKYYIEDIKAKGSVVLINKDPNLGTNFLYLLYLLNNGNYLVLSTPLVAIQENADIANRFFLFSGLAIILLAAGPIFLLTKRYTQPILELKNIAQSMSNLDFSRRYTVNTNDEIGELGSSINSLSDQLGQAISELQEANEKLRKDIERERQIDEMRKEFVSSVSHELKTPISLIQGYAEGLKVNVVQEEKDKIYYCDVIMDEANKMNKLVRELLDLSQIESGYFKLEKEVFNLGDLIDELINKYTPIFTEKGIKPLINKEPEVMVWADMGRTEQILVNFLNNALNHINEGRDLEINVDYSDDKVHIGVFNSGPNIPEDALELIFTSFYKADKARTRQYGGTGLGLSIVKALQELDGNNYGVRNLIDGVEFWFELDRANLEEI